MLNETINLEGKTVLVTGAAGFIGANLVRNLFKNIKGIQIIGLDNMNNYYDVGLKKYRLKNIEKQIVGMKDTKVDFHWRFIKGSISDKQLVNDIFQNYRPDIVVNLAAQAGVRYSISNPDDYIESNIVGFYNILEACRHSYSNGTKGVEHLVYASSSSVYGLNKKIPYSVDDKVDHPVSLYAATKKSNELLAHAYSKLYNIPSTGLRFFTVYGPAGRPDMAYFIFTNRLLAGKDIEIFNYGNCQRDFTYIDDVINGIQLVMGHVPKRSKGIDGLPAVPYAVYNIGNNHPENLLDFVDILQDLLVKEDMLPIDYDFASHKKLVPMQPGDVSVTFANIDDMRRDFGYVPTTPINIGLYKFVKWYKNYYGY